MEIHCPAISICKQRLQSTTSYILYLHLHNRNDTILKLLHSHPVYRAGLLRNLHRAVRHSSILSGEIYPASIAAPIYTVLVSEPVLYRAVSPDDLANLNDRISRAGLRRKLIRPITVIVQIAQHHTVTQ